MCALRVNLLKCMRNSTRTATTLGYNSYIKSNLVVQVRTGKLRGETKQLGDGSPYYSFKGIPYAQAARFTAPLPLKPWQGIHDATKHGAECIQYDSMTKKVKGQENCLFLNVYTKSLLNDSKLPVMVFIHGGGYLCGSGNVDSGFGPEFLLQHDVILVTFNYRLEVLGFLSLDTPEVPGNCGMKDQVAALRWVQENIKYFGGDPDNVTIFGESSGGASVTFHLQSKMSKGLFHKAISQSGVSIAEIYFGRDGKQRAFRTAKVLGCDSTDESEVTSFLRSVPATLFPKMTYKTMTDDEKYRGYPLHFIPTVEKKIKDIEAFITNEPIHSLMTGDLTNVPLMIGLNSNEYIPYIDDFLMKLNHFNKYPLYLVPREIALKVTETEMNFLGKKIKQFYIGDKDFTNEDYEILGMMMFDSLLIYNIHRYAAMYSQLSPTYMYKFCCDTELNVMKKLTKYPHAKGAVHGDELFYLFYNNMNKQAFEKDPELKEVGYKVTKMWTDFSKTGNPTPDKSLEVKWTPYTTLNPTYLNIDRTLKMEANSEENRVKFWDSIYNKAELPCIATSANKFLNKS